MVLGVVSWCTGGLSRPERDAVNDIVGLPALGGREASAFRMVWRGIDSTDTAPLRWFRKELGTRKGNCGEDGSDGA